MIIYYIDFDINITILLPMSFLDLNNDVKTIISKHVLNDSITTMFTSKHCDLQKMFFCEIVFDDATFNRMKRKKHFVVKFYLITTLIKLKAHLIVCQMMMIFICQMMMIFIMVKIY
jgi:hypothetical protein